MKFGKIISAILVLVLMLYCVPVSASSIPSDNAIIYLDIIRNLPKRGIFANNTYLVDFENDGVEELLILHGDFREFEEMHYEVYKGATMVAQAALETPMTSPYLYKKGDKIYFVQGPSFGDTQGLTTYCMENGVWVKDTDFRAWFKDGLNRSCYINGVQVAESEYTARIGEYRMYSDLCGEFTVNFSLLDAINVTYPEYKDVLYSDLDYDERKALFDDFLYDIAYCDGEIDVLSETDEELVDLLSDARMDTDMPISGEPFPIDEFNKLTMQYFGRTIDYTKFLAYSEPTCGLKTTDDYGYESLFYNNTFYLCHPQRGSSVDFEYCIGEEPHLYHIGGNTYYATFKLTSTYGEEYIRYMDAYGAIVKKNDDGTFRLVKMAPIMTKEALYQIANPSDWAKADIDKAEKAGLIPNLHGEPLWKDTATRLQFAQLTVNMVEKLTGKTLPKAPASTFGDCSDDAVLKAYKAGIINGTSEKAFSPDVQLTREQIATMLYRAISYIEKETGKTIADKNDVLGAYEDASSVSDWARTAVAILANNGIMNGTSDTALSPKLNASIEQCIILVLRLYDKVN